MRRISIKTDFLEEFSVRCLNVFLVLFMGSVYKGAFIRYINKFIYMHQMQLIY